MVLGDRSHDGDVALAQLDSQGIDITRPGTLFGCLAAAGCGALMGTIIKRAYSAVFRCQSRCVTRAEGNGDWITVRRT
ncbi:hypothetical protein M879_21655 [Mycobacteroides abscessus V06705]|nr:hypothetical protein M879_21655 [Mycobacteroides abscessus V06705]